MHRISTDSDYLKTGQVIIDADGIPVDVPDRTQMDAANQALGQRIDAEKWWRGALGSADTLDTLHGSSSQGLYRITPAVGGGPGLPGWVEITYDSNSARTRQVFTSSSPSDAVSLERKYAGGVWREWTPVTWHGAVVTSGNADDLLAPHAYAINATGVSNLPVATLGSLQTLPSGSGATTLTQIFVSSEATPRMWTRTRRNSVWGQWVRWATHQDVEDIATHLIDEHRYVAPTMTMPSRETPLSGGAGVIQSFSTDGKVGYNALTAELRQTLDEGATWQPVRTFGGNYTEWTRMLPNGELMVSTSGTVGGVSGRRVWVSTGYRPEAPTAATWEVVLTPAAPYVKFADWSISITDEMVLMAEYGPKSGMVWGSGTDIIPEGQNARYVYQSLDNGKTWSTIFDLNAFLLSNGRDTADRQHLHGVAWDKWWQRIWVSFGDASGDGTNGVLYSDDRGGTWETAYWTHTHPSQGWQVVGIQPMKDCVLFAGDMTPSGVIRLDRAQGKNSFVFETGWDFSETDKHLCHVITYQDGPMGEIALFAFAREGSASPSFILGTRDGFTFEVLWQETGASLPGIRSVAGPSAQGTIIAAVNSASGWLEVRGTLTAHGTPLVADPTISLGQRIDGKADKQYVDTELNHSISSVGDSDQAGKLLKLNPSGKLHVFDGSIASPNDVVNKRYVDNKLDHSISSVGASDQAGKLLKLNASGKLHVFDGGITEPNDVVNKRYVDNQTAHSVSSVGDETQAGKHLKLNDKGKVTVWDSSISEPHDVVNKRYVDRVIPTVPAPTRAPLSNPGGWEQREVPAAEYPKTMSKDRTTWFTGGWSTVWQSTDQGETWEVLHKFPSSCFEIVEANDGELFAFVGVPRTVYKSVGYPTLGVDASWEPVLTMTNPGASISYTRSFSQHENIVVIGEYSPKYGNNATFGENGRWVWLSLDYGNTFKTIFDLNAFVEPKKGNTIGIHVHGVLWDPYWDRIWVTFGDDVDGIVYSDDLGATWETAKYGDHPTAPGQVVGAVAMPNCILFGSDNDDNGVFKIDRAPGKAGPYVLEKAWQFPESGVGMRTHLCHHSSRVQRPGDDGPAIFGFSAEDRPAKSFLVSTYDGVNFTVLWQDDRISEAGKGLKSVLGPTLSGEFILGLNDGPGNQWLELRGPAGIY